MSDGSQRDGESVLDWAAFPAVDAATWRSRVERDLKGRNPDSLRRTLFDGVTIESVYADHDAALPTPGTGDRTRGLGRPGWKISVAHDLREQAPADLARALAHDAQLGAEAIWIAFENPRQVSEALVKALRAAAPRAELWWAGCESAALHGVQGMTAVVDPLSALARRGRLPVSIDELAAAAVDAVRRDGAALGIDTAVYADAGAELPQQLGVLLATGVSYLRWAEARGLSLDEVAPRIWGTVAVGHDLFAEIAKLRAARRLWARLAAACGVGADARGLSIRAVGSARVRTRRDPWVNLLRGTTETFAAAVGGAQMIGTLALDVALPDHPGHGADFGRRLAINTQVLLAEESHLGQVLDPAGGSGYVEALTDDLARAGWDAFVEIEREGGLEASLRAGAVQARTAAQHQRAAELVARRRQAIVGVSEFPALEEVPVPGAHSTRARTPDPGAPAEIDPLPLRRLAEPFETLRDRADALAQRRGRRPRVRLLGLGPLAEHKPRVDFATNLLWAGGFEVELSEPIEAAADVSAPDSVDAIVLCGSDARYGELGAEVLRALAADPDAPRIRILAGRAGELESGLRAAGLTHELFLGGDAVTLLDALLTAAEGEA